MPIEECVDCISISELETKTDFNESITLFDDLYSDILIRAELNKACVDFSTPLSIETRGYHELYLQHLHETKSKDTIYQFVLIDAERGESEWGLAPWTPKPFEVQLNGSEPIELIYPKIIPSGISVPIIVFAGSINDSLSVYTSALANDHSFNIKNGVGSVNYYSNDITPIDISIGTQTHKANLNYSDAIAGELEGSMDEKTILDSNNVYRITSDLFIEQGVVLTVQSGAVLQIDEGVNIYNSGKIHFEGTRRRPILVTSTNENTIWGGIISTGGGAEIIGDYAFFCNSGYYNTGEFSYGHANHQALFRVANSYIRLTNCYMLDNKGQIFYPTESSVQLSGIVVQRAKTAGELSHSLADISNSYFSDFPDDSDNFRDEDNDALYLSNSNAIINNCCFMYAKDDGLDTGSDDGGMVTVTNCLFEACFHEGLAMASYEGAIKKHTIKSSVFRNCGQGIEMGFSSSNHTALVENCLFTKNYIGIRYGDNYTWAKVNGQIVIKNSQSMHNIEKDVWNMVRSIWAPKLENMTLVNTSISIPSRQYPHLKLVD